VDKRANKFFESWVSKHLKPTPMPEHFAEAERLANTCVADAKEAGISEAEIEQELAQDIVSAHHLHRGYGFRTAASRLPE
jgi:hypothetical protein